MQEIKNIQTKIIYYYNLPIVQENLLYIYGGLLFILLLLVTIFLINFLKNSKKKVLITNKNIDEIVEDIPVEASKKTWKQRLHDGLGQSRSEVWGKLAKVFSGRRVSDETIEEVEEILYSADVGNALIQELITDLNNNIDREFQENEFIEYIKGVLKTKAVDVQATVKEELFSMKKEQSKLNVIMVVGINGVGKTTTVGKLASKLSASGAKVVVGACDTFRAAAVEQLEIWATRSNAEFVKGKEGSGPSGVAYDALEKAIKLEADYCILDTAGRLHNNEGLMEELAKTKRVLGKLIPEAPHESILVLDAITGQNALSQAREFNSKLDLTGLIFTKCDGSSKAGSAITIVNELQKPIYYLGVGESVDDLNRFDLDEYLDALLS